MPKLITYKRPVTVTKQDWKHAPDRKASVPRKAPEQEKPQAPTLSLPALEQLLRKE